MHELTQELIQKLGVLDVQCKKPIRGCRGFYLYELVTGILRTDSLEELAREWGYSSSVPIKQALRKHITPYFSHRSKEFGANVVGVTNSWKNEFLYFLDKKLCKKCNNIKSIDEFGSNNSKGIHGIRAECKRCHTLDTKYQKIDINTRTPKWSDLSAIREIYSKCPTDKHVDHIIPLRGTHVSGLHVPNNLTYLDPIDNMSKGNRFDIN